MLVAQANSYRKKGKPMYQLWKEYKEVDIEELTQLVHKQKKENVSNLLKRIRGE